MNWVRRGIGFLLLVLVLAGLAACQAEGGRNEGLGGTGTVEAEEVTVASLVGGRIRRLAVQRGDRVKAGEVLVELDARMVEADLARTEAVVESLRAARDAAYRAWQAALQAEANPQEVDLQIAQVRAQLKGVELQIQGAQVAGDEGALAAATATRDGLEEILRILEEIRDAPYGLQAQAGQAEVIYRALESLLPIAEGTLDALRLQREETILTAPRDGYVLERLASEGEVVAPFMPILVLADLERVTVTVYLPEDRYGAVKLGQEVQVTADSFPGKIFLGRVVYISPEAEFSPAGVPLGEDRTRLVYGVEVALDNPDLELKPGMIVDVAFGDGP